MEMPQNGWLGFRSIEMFVTAVHPPEHITL